ncbi:MAG: ABC transporter substrate-binding protein [Holosporales bacterium]|jgi:polar amino acid transport system substrate-binding protein|nr:ABC transporter substrate-binding protein [Holosporales bacterium]
MKNPFCKIFFAIASFVLVCTKSGATEDTIRFVTCADYPPFEYFTDGEIVGFDIDLARLVARKLGKTAVFENMPFSAMFAALQNGMVDVGVSTITATAERRKNIDFSSPYYTGSLVVLFRKGEPVADKTQLSQQKVACQLGTTMEIWLKDHVPNAERVIMDNNNQVVQAVISGHVRCGLMETSQAKAFSAKTGLQWNEIACCDAGYAFAFKKGSPLRKDFEAALAELQAEGEIQKLGQKWLHH